MKLVDSQNISTIRDLEVFLSWSPDTRPVLLLVGLIVVIAGVAGNVLVVYSSYLNGVLKVDKISRVFLRLLAITDCLMSLTVYVPLFLTIAFKTWVLGSALCFYVGKYTRHETFQHFQFLVLF